MKLYQKYIKRVLDTVLSLILIVMLVPVYLIIAVLVAIKLGKPIIFKQSRPGLNERIFTMMKFRSMTSAKDNQGRLLPDAVRLTRFGKLLRSTSLDELPELINIFKGEMSFVGPRPLLVSYLPLYNDDQRKRHNVRPGLTGLAQVNGRNQITWEQKFQMDIQYVNNCTFWMDFKILLKTAGVVLKREDVNSSNQATTSIFTGTEVS